MTLQLRVLGRLHFVRRTFGANLSQIYMSISVTQNFMVFDTRSEHTFPQTMKWSNFLASLKRDAMDFCCKRNLPIATHVVNSRQIACFMPPSTRFPSP